MTDSQKTQARRGWLILVAALGAMLSLLAADVQSLGGWHEATTPAFVAQVMAHLGAVIAAFVGGKLIPTKEDA